MTDSILTETPDQPPKKKHRLLKGLGIAAALTVAIGVGASMGGEESTPNASPAATETDEPETEMTDEQADALDELSELDEQAADHKPKPAPEPEPEPEPAEPELTVAQEQAIGSAGSYLEYTAFSRTGLIEQLEFEGFSTKDATFAVDSVDVNWKLQAAKSAEAYLEYTSFSHSGLVEQLVFEGFTQEQAEYGVQQVGL